MPWHCKVYGAYAKESIEAKENAVEIMNVLMGLGWTLNAVCGVLGNIGYEGGYNPWRWQADQVLASTDTYEINNHTGHAYGLCQFDEAAQYINPPNDPVYPGYGELYPGFGPNFSDITGSQTDGEAQMMYVHYHGAYIPTFNYPMTYQEYRESTLPADYLAEIWFYNYERGTWIPARETEALYWYDYLQNIAPGHSHKFKWIYYMKRRIK